MSPIFSIGFRYNDTSFYALARIRERQGKTEYVITVMNGELESLLYGNHIFLLENGQVAASSGKEELAVLKESIRTALAEYLGTEQPALSVI